MAGSRLFGNLPPMADAGDYHASPFWPPKEIHRNILQMQTTDWAKPAPEAAIFNREHLLDPRAPQRLGGLENVNFAFMREVFEKVSRLPSSQGSSSSSSANPAHDFAAVNQIASSLAAEASKMAVDIDACQSGGRRANQEESAHRSETDGEPEPEDGFDDVSQQPKDDGSNQFLVPLMPEPSQRHKRMQKDVGMVHCSIAPPFSPKLSNDVARVIAGKSCPCAYRHWRKNACTWNLHLTCEAMRARLDDCMESPGSKWPPINKMTWHHLARLLKRHGREYHDEDPKSVLLRRVRQMQLKEVLWEGLEVAVYGLYSNTGFNGQIGRIIEWSPTTGLWRVQLPCGIKLLNPVNLDASKDGIQKAKKRQKKVVRMAKKRCACGYRHNGKRSCMVLLKRRAAKLEQLKRAALSS